MYKFCVNTNSKESACNAGHLGSTLGSGRFLGEGNVNPLHFSCLENFTEVYSPWGCKDLDTTERLFCLFVLFYLCFGK